MQNDFSNMNIKDTKKVTETFYNNIVKGYIRKPMEEFAYLKENITLQWYYQVLVLLGNIILSSFITWKFLNNYSRKRNW